MMNYQECSDSELYSMVCESNEDAKEYLYNKYKYVIDVIVKKYIYTAKKLGIEYNDLYQEGLVGFADALNHYDESKNVMFSTFLSLCIDRKLQNAILKAGRLKNKIILESLSLDHVYEEYQIPLSEMISDKNSDPLLGISVQEEIKELKEQIQSVLSQSEYEVYQYMEKGVSPKQIDNTIQRIKHKIKLIVKKVED